MHNFYASLFVEQTVVALFVHILENIAWLAFEYPAYFLECGEADGFGFTAFKYAHIGNGNAHPFAEFGKAHLATGQHDIEVYYYGHIN
jgi:hypothetical protein